MTGPALATALCASAAAAWAAAAIELLGLARRHRSYPDQVFGVALFAGAVLLGVDMLEIQTAEPLPLASITLALAALCAFGFGRADGATALLPSDRLRLWLAGAGTALLLHLLHGFIGAQPTIGPGLRPFELPLAALLLVQARNARKLPASFLAGPTPFELAALLASAALAGIVNATGIDAAPALGALSLALGPLPFLVRRARTGERTARRAAAVAVAAALVCLVRGATSDLEQSARERAELRRAASDTLAQAEALRAPLDEALASWAVDQPRQNLAAADAELTARLSRLLDAAAAPGVQAPVRRAMQAQSDHARLAADLFQAVEQRELHWDSAERRERAEARARTLHREAEMALTALHQALAALGRTESALASSAAGELGALGDALLWLLAAVALLGAALCAGDEPAGPMPVLRGSVLLVEDGPLQQRLVSHMLSSSGVDVTLADSGPGALQLLENEHFDVVLMDVQLPGLDGLAVTTRMRERGDHTPVIALGAGAGEADRERAFQAGCNTHLNKPVDRTSLAATLAMYLSPPR